MCWQKFILVRRCYELKTLLNYIIFMLLFKLTTGAKSITRVHKNRKYLKFTLKAFLKQFLKLL